MNGEKPSRIGIISAVIRKDASLMSRDFLFIFMTVLSLVFFVAMYWLLPKDVDETITLGVSGNGIEAAFEALAGEEGGGLGVSWFDGADAVRNGLRSGPSSRRSRPSRRQGPGIPVSGLRD